MSRTNTRLLKAALCALRYTGTDNLVAPMTTGVGVIFMLHHVGPDTGKTFEPNRILRVTPEFLNQVIGEVVDSGFDVISLDDVPARVAAGRDQKPFACFTFDDGYRDNRDHAYPIFVQHGLPFAIYVPSDFADGRGDLWWLVLERAIAALREVRVSINGVSRVFETVCDAQKLEAFHSVYWWLRTLPEDDARRIVSGLAERARLDISGLCQDLAMSWDELRALARDPLVTIGAHTTGHYALAKLSCEDARAEMADSINRVERELGQACRHFSYPYGSRNCAGPREFELARELGVVTAVTTQKGLVHKAHANALTALPRVSLNGEFQDIRYVKTLLSGAPFALLNAVERLSGWKMSA